MRGLRDLLSVVWYGKQLQIPTDATPALGVGIFNAPSLGADKTLIAPGNYVSQVAAFKGPVHGGLSLTAKKVGAATLRIYKPKTTQSKSLLYVTRTRPVPEPRRTELLTKAAPGSVLSLADQVEEVVGKHRLIDLLTSVNEHYDIYQLQYVTAAYLGLTGNCYWVLIRDSLKIPTAIWIAPAEYMRVKPGDSMTVAGYVYRHGKIKLEFDANEVIHFKSPAPGVQFQFYGRGDLMGAIDDFNLLQHMYRFERAMFENGGIPATFLSTETDWTEEEKNSYKEQFFQKFGGSAKAGKTMVGSNVKVQPLGMSPREMAYQAARKFSNTNIYSNMGTPEALMTGQVSTRAALDASIAQVAIFTIDPMLALIQQALNAQLIPLYKDPIYVEYDSEIPQDKEFQLKEDVALLEAGAVSPDEVRGRRGQEPIEGGDVAYMGANRVPLGTEVARQPAQPTQAQINDIATKALEEAKSRIPGE